VDNIGAQKIGHRWLNDKYLVVTGNPGLASRLGVLPLTKAG
jgi:hypothetical protein